MPRPHRLVTLVFSHYNEKARWALDRCGIDYEERAYMPGFSQLGVMMATRGRGGKADAVSSKFSTPVLITKGGERLCDSTDIARWAASQVDDETLFPNDEVGELVAHYGRKLGPQTRLAAYWVALRSKTALPKMAKANVGAAQALAFRVMAPLGLSLIKNGLGVNESAYHRAIDRVRAELDDAGRRLERTRYLAGDSFTAADLTFASLLAPVLLVTRDEGYGAVFPDVMDFPEDTRALVAEVRGTRAGAFAIDMFRRHRRETIA